MSNAVTKLTTKPAEEITITDLMKNALAFANDVVEGKLSPAQSSSAARHYANVAKMLDLRCRFGNLKVTE